MNQSEIIKEANEIKVGDTITFRGSVSPICSAKVSKIYRARTGTRVFVGESDRQVIPESDLLFLDV